MNNGVTNGLKQKKARKHVCKTALHGKIKERRETKGEWLIGVLTQIVKCKPFNCNQTIKDKAKARKAPFDEDNGS